MPDEVAPVDPLPGFVVLESGMRSDRLESLHHLFLAHRFDHHGPFLCYHIHGLASWRLHCTAGFLLLQTIRAAHS